MDSSAKLFCAIFVILGLSGCVQTYRIHTANAASGIQFTVAPGSSHPSGCVNWIKVSVEAPDRTTEALPTDDIGFAQKGDVYWLERSGVSHSCENTLPLRYGAPLNASNFENKAAEPLILGNIYRVETGGGPGGRGRGSGRFRILPDGDVQNVYRTRFGYPTEYAEYVYVPREAN